MVMESLGVLPPKVLEFLRFFSMLTHGLVVDVVVWLSCWFDLDGVLAGGLGCQSADDRALTGEHGDVMLSGEAGFAGQGFARNMMDFSSVGEMEGGDNDFSSIGDRGGGDLDALDCFFSL